MIVSVIAGGCCVGACGVALAQDTRSAPVLVEMFLSQSCSASPPAGEFMTTLGERKDLVALTWHVDYWKSFAGRSGETWTDPFSKPAFAERQRAYNRRIRGKDRGMTPQAVVNGAVAFSGAQRDSILSLTEAAKALPPATVSISFDREGDTLQVSVSGAKGEASLIRFLETAEVFVRGGDNAGIIFRDANVVTDVVMQGQLEGGALRWAAPPLRKGEGCAVVVQEGGQGRVLAAQYCPS